MTRYVGPISQAIFRGLEAALAIVPWLMILAVLFVVLAL